ncbi:MAG: ABC transporter ATP-binding protein [Paracoccaceae bacterium]
MARIDLENLGHCYGGVPRTDADYALKPLNLTWEDGKTYALLGPSGCGKTTMLNIISGLLEPSQGRLLFDRIDVTTAPTSVRNIAQVFQFPVIYTTMSVRYNLSFPLVCRNMPADRIGPRVADIARLLDLDQMLDMPAKRLTADQKQLISLGRGLVREDVSAILLDEPLTVIDPQMKFALRRKLREINRRTGVTMVLVTHDQNEAMTFADEVVVMRDGRVLQAGSPEALFARPSNAFVGYFIGSPPINMIPLVAKGKRLASVDIAIDRTPENIRADARYELGIRPENLSLLDDDTSALGQARISKIEDIGMEGIISLKFPSGLELRVRTRQHRKLRIDQIVGLTAPDEEFLLYENGELVAC